MCPNNSFLRNSHCLYKSNGDLVTGDPVSILLYAACSPREHAAYKRILTGSPVTKSPLDLYKQCEFLKKELLGHTSYYTFRTRYAVMKTANFGGKSVQIVTGYQHLPELSEKLKPFSYRVLKDDCFFW